MSSYVGFANLPNQMHRKSVKRGFEFCLMVVGESGLGKSTLVNSLFATNLYAGREPPSAKDKIAKTVQIEASTVEIEERGFRLKLTVVDTPGFGDRIDNSECFDPIVNYVNEKFEKYLADESGLNRRNISDNRVHCCFYFLAPSGVGLRPIDVKFMKLLHDKVNIVPLIAKADTLMKEELIRMKRKVIEQIQSEKINIYQIPDCDNDEDEEFKEMARSLQEAVPYAVVGSNCIVEIKGRKTRARQYPWGMVEVENEEHCDFSKLRTMLITYMQDLKDVTGDYHYESFRAKQLSKPGPLSTQKTRGKQTNSEVSVTEEDKDKMLREKEEELRRMQEMIAKIQEQMKQQQQQQK